MGGFYGSVHIRSGSFDLIKGVLENLSKKEGYKFYMSKPISGWIGIFPDNYGQIPLAGAIAEFVDFDVLGLMVHDDDFFCYWYYRNKKLIDEYNSFPDYFGEETSRSERNRLKGRPEVFTHLVNSSGEIDEIGKILKPSFSRKPLELPKKIREQVQKWGALSKEISVFVNTPEKVKNFLSENPQLSEETFKSLAKEAKSKGLKDPEELRKYVEINPKMHELIIKIVEEFRKSRMNSEEYRILHVSPEEQKEMNAEMNRVFFEKGFTNKVRNLEDNEYLFASHRMEKFACCLGISNSVTSYEYIASGEVDNIVGLKDFIHVP
jgi:hypothetical protein